MAVDLTIGMTPRTSQAAVAQLVTSAIAFGGRSKMETVRGMKHNMARQLRSNILAEHSFIEYSAM
jgi:hypothetical protein